MLTVRVQNIYVRVIQCDAARDVHTTVAHVQRSLAYVEWGLLRSMNRSSWMGKKLENISLPQNSGAIRSFNVVDSFQSIDSRGKAL